MNIGKSFIVIFLGLFLLNNSIDVYAQEEIWVANGEKALMNGKFEEAVQNFTKVIEKNQKNQMAYFNRGMAFLYMMEFPAAAADFTKAIELDSTDADSYNNRGLANTYMGNLEVALNDFNKSISLDPKFAEAYMNRGTAYIEMMNYPPAMEDLNKAIKLFDKQVNPNAYYERGRVYYKTKKTEEAIKDFTSAINSGIKTSKIFLSRGNAYYKLNDFKNAIKDYSTSLALEPNDMETMNNRAMAYEKAGDTVKAQVDRAVLAARKQALLKQFPSLDSLKFKIYTNSSDEYSLTLPESWQQKNLTTQYSNDMLVTMDKIATDSSFYNVGVRMSLNKDMKVQYEVESDPESLLAFWKGSNLKNAEDYYVYDVISQKMMNKNGYNCMLNKVRIQYNKKSIPMIMYELAYAKNNVLFYAYFQAPEVQFEYYGQIFDKAIASFSLK